MLGRILGASNGERTDWVRGSAHEWRPYRPIGALRDVELCIDGRGRDDLSRQGLRANLVLDIELVDERSLAAVLAAGEDAEVAMRSFEGDLARRWAPVHRQSVSRRGSDGLSGKADYVTRIDFDGDWDPTDNWESLPEHPAHAACYYSVVTTRTHWYLIYAFYHPRDWSSSLLSPVRHLDSHENDLEGALVVVRRSAVEPSGVLEGMITVFHRDFYSFTPEGSPLQSGREDVDGRVRFDSTTGARRPVTWQEAEGHGLKAWSGRASNGSIRYVPGDRGAEPGGTDDTAVPYELVDIFGPDGLWSRRDDRGLFERWGRFRGDQGGGSAHAPWRWDDHDDGPHLTGGELAVDPARVVSIYFTGLGDFACDYERNPYLSR
ncbi:MAG: hypothetical protein AAF602_29335 [Myxococcota bacterium]